MEALLNIQEDLLQRLIKAEVNYKKSPKDRVTSSYLNTRLENIDTLFKSFMETHREIIKKTTAEQRSTLVYFKKDFYEQFEELYTSHKSSLRETLRIMSPTTPMPAQESSRESISTGEVRLPQIQLPTFSGKYCEWQPFYDLFTAVIDQNKSLSLVQKLHYLKSALSGEAATLIRNLSTTELNYKAAWEKLTKRYNNRRYVCNEILRTLFSQRQINVESANAIKGLLDTTTSCLTSLNNLDIATNTWDAMIIYLVVSKLDNESLRQWEINVSGIPSDALPKWKDLIIFLESRFRTLEMIDCNKPLSRTLQPVAKRPDKVKSFASVHGDKTPVKTHCVKCSGDHLLFQCKTFAQLAPRERYEYVQTKALCFNCLAPNHAVSNCRQSTCCRRCGRRHHSLLHLEKENNQGTTSNSDRTSNNSKRPTLENQTATALNEVKTVANFSKETEMIETSHVLLATAVVRAYSRSGQPNLLRALIDQGSQSSFVTEEAVQLLGLRRFPVNGCVSGLGDGQLRIRHMVSFNVEANNNSKKSIRVTAYVLKTLTSRIPSTKVQSPDWLEIENLSLADAGFSSPGRIDLLLGAEVYSEILLMKMLKHPQGHLLAQNTIFGWVISGRASQSTSASKRTLSLHVQVREDSLLKQFWELENEPNTIKKRLTKEEEKCEEIYKNTTFRNAEGRIVVRLPFDSEDPECQYGNLKDIAQRRFSFLEKKFQKNPKFKEEYTKVMEGYLDRNHMVRINNETSDPKAVFIPHHAVVKENRDTTKLRIVCDASCKGKNGVSLNDNLLVGPKLQQDLRHILMRWRKHRICIVADIIKMYMQVRVHHDDTRFQRILWRPNPDESLGQYELLTVTFGMACAPYLAIKSLQHLADKEQHKYPIAADITRQDFYVDDLMTGCQTEMEAVEIYTQINKMLNSGGFHLQKWSSNSKSVLQYIGDDKQNDAQSIIIKSDNIVKVLGICWNRDTDDFQYTVELPEISQPVTKRKVLSDIARLYDPMGWIAPVVVIAKAFVQKLWKLRLDWDEILPDDVLNEWMRYRGELTQLKTVLIPRWLHYSHNCEVELHAFADASQLAYAAVVYLRVKQENGEIYVHLVSAKTKVAPIEKELSIPRLELCGAVLATKLLFEISQVMSVTKDKLYAWSDSTIVLAWLRGLPSRWTTFVSNRVSDILTIIDSEQFRHVGTKMNPADCASRGLRPSDLNQQSLWWDGPEWLHQQSFDLPKSHYSTQEEVRASNSLEIKSLVAVKKDMNKDFLTEEAKLMWSKYSSLKKMLRIVSYVRRVLQRRLKESDREKYPKFITVKEMNDALMMCVKQVQELRFGVEIQQLKTQGSVSKKNILHALNPFLDDKGILRVGGRIHLARLSDDERHPMIMPEISHFTQVIIADAHNSTLHSGPQAMLNYIRGRFWIIRARQQVKKYFRRCIICIRYSQRKNPPLMGQLPEVRLVPSKPFKSTGVDYAGPINIRFSPGRGAKTYKGYICLFICMVTRAMHIEAVSDLTSKGFMAAFRRFVSRRGRCQDIYSDNGTNFVGADKELREIFDAAKSRLPNEIAELLTVEGTNWNYIPPYSPNFGGLWEAGVRSIKTHLRKIIGDSTLTFEELCTVLTQIEACLNSRPLSLLSDHSVDPLPLTPGHFLVGEPLVNVIENYYQDKTKNVTGLDRWRLVQKMTNDFWDRWSKDYLLNLGKRYKWGKKQSEPEIDDVVIIREENVPPTKWILGKIVHKHPGIDNVTRVVTVKCQDKLLKRPVSKLCILPK